jgi:hypothetical protein
MDTPSTNFKLLETLKKYENKKECCVCNKKSEVICRDCTVLENPFFCDSCFDKEHSSFISKSHKKHSIEIESFYCEGCNSISHTPCSIKNHKVVQPEELNSYTKEEYKKLKDELANKPFYKSKILALQYSLSEKKIFYEHMCGIMKTSMDNCDKVFEKNLSDLNLFMNCLEDISEKKEADFNIQNLVEIKKKCNISPYELRKCSTGFECTADIKFLQKYSKFPVSLEKGDEIEGFFTTMYSDFKSYRGIVVEEEGSLSIHWNDGDIMKDIYKNIKLKNVLIRLVRDPNICGSLF